MNLRSIVWLAILFLTVLVLAACGPQPLPVAPTPIPTLIPATLPPPEAVPTAATGGETAPPAALPGEAVFQANCSACHNLTAERKVGPGLAGLFGRASLPNGNPVTEENLKEWIRNGGGAMPGIPLGDQELEAIVAFLKAATQ